MSRSKIKRGAYSSHNKLNLLRSAEYFVKLEQLIDEAKYTLHLQTYIFDTDETGKKIADALIRAAERKVQVYVLLDGYASQSFSDTVREQFKTSGIKLAFFKPVFKTTDFYFGRRLHHKVVVADACRALVGGINISNRYNDMPGQEAWLDWAVITEGDAAAELNKICIRIWNRSRLRKKFKGVSVPANKTEEECKVRVRRNDWVHRLTQITRTYKDIFSQAEKHITLMSSYFLPSAQLLRRMEQAANRGVKIRLILAGTSDVAIAKNAERYVYRRLFKKNIDIYEYQPSVLHAKVATYDSKWATIGSYNVNNISAFASIELNLDINDEGFATQLNEKLEQIIETNCVKITEETYKTRYSYMRKVLQKLSYKVFHVLFFFFTFYFKQSKYRN